MDILPRKLTRRLALLILLLPLIFAGPVQAEDGEGGRLQRIGLLVSSGSSIYSDFDYDYIGLHPFWGIFLTDPGPGYRGSWEFAVELFFNKFQDDFSDESEFGFTPTIRWHYGFEQTVSPYIELGAGMLYSNRDIPDTGADINFDAHIGAGANFRVSDDVHIMTGYRWRHVSNGNTHERNSGVDYNQVLFGLSFLH